MSPSKVLKKIVIDRIAWVERMVNEIRSLSLASLESFRADARNVCSAESCLRRTLEALFDIGRHVMAKRFGLGLSEYREIAGKLADYAVLSNEDSALLKILAGYRNRLVHFYPEISTDERYQICSRELGDVTKIM
jgi:uncharacterized protein YutE (UPF0331/DUF86 family)